MSGHLNRLVCFPSVGVFLAFLLIGSGAHAQAAGDLNASIVCQSVPDTMIHDQEYHLAITMKNTGATTSTGEWNSLAGIRIAPEGALSTWGVKRVVMSPPGERIISGQEKTFSYTVKAPNTGTTVTSHWRMLNEIANGAGQPVSYFGNFSDQAITLMSRSAVVTAYTGGANSGWYSRPTRQVVPCTMTAGETYFVDVAFQNIGIGGKDWTPTTAGLKNVTATNWGTPSFVPMDSGELVTQQVFDTAIGGSQFPTTVKMFRFKVTAPTTPGSYPFRWRMVRLSNNQEFGQYSPLVPVNVVSPATRHVVDGLDYLVSDQHATQGMTGPGVQGVTSATSQTVIGNKVYYTYYGHLESPSVLRPQFIIFTWDDSYIYLIEDTSFVEKPIAYYPGVWMRRYMDVAPHPNSVIYMSQNKMQFLTPDLVGNSASRCIPAASPTAWGYRNTLESIGHLSPPIGGVVGDPLIVTLKNEWSLNYGATTGSGCERFFWDKTWGGVRHQRFFNADCSGTPGQQGTLNALLLDSGVPGKRHPDLTRECAIPTPMLEY